MERVEDQGIRMTLLSGTLIGFPEVFPGVSTQLPLNTSSSGFSSEAKIFESVPVTSHQLLSIQKSQLAVRWFDGVFLALKSIKMIALAIPVMI